MRLLGLAALLLVAGCTSAPQELLRYEGTGCTEVGFPFPVDGTVAQFQLPLGFTALPARAVSPDMPEGAALAVVAVNHCAFGFPGAGATQAEAFLWLYVVPPEPLRLPGQAHHTFELAHWMPPGPGLDALRGAVPGAAPARVEGVPAGGLGPNMSFALVVEPEAGGRLVLNGTAGGRAGTLDHPEGPCCRTFARHGEGLVATDFVSTDQPRAEARCAMAPSPRLVPGFLDGGALEGPCSVNEAFGFKAQVRRVR